jgi:hypothetical protein
MEMDDRITKKAPYGRHIGLTCVNHPELSWNTKNIAPIGCRTIFFNGWDESPPKKECDCPLRDLRVVEIEGEDVPT